MRLVSKNGKAQTHWSAYQKDKVRAVFGGGNPETESNNQQ